MGHYAGRGIRTKLALTPSSAPNGVKRLRGIGRDSLVREVSFGTKRTPNERWGGGGALVMNSAQKKSAPSPLLLVIVVVVVVVVECCCF